MVRHDQTTKPLHQLESSLSLHKTKRTTTTECEVKLENKVVILLAMIFQ